MNKLQLDTNRKNNFDLLDNSYNIKTNRLKFNVREDDSTLKHELAKFLLAYELQQNKKKYVCEAIFKNGKRADLFILDNGEAYEVVKSETKESMKNKEEDYPVPITFFNAQDVINHWKKHF